MFIFNLNEEFVWNGSNNFSVVVVTGEFTSYLSSHLIRRLEIYIVDENIRSPF